MSKQFLYGAALMALVFALPATAVSDQSIPDDLLGLSKTSVFDTPAPPLVPDNEPDVGTVGKRVVRSYMTAPPMIPHTVKDMLPITRDSNLCKDCHVVPDLLGQKITKGMPVPAPASHYVDVKNGEFYMGRWNCIQCHRPQTDAKLLVDNVFGASGKAHAGKK